MVLGLVTGNIEEGARIKLLPTGLWPHFRVGAYGSDHMDRRRLPSLATRRAHALVGYAFVPPEVIVIGDTPHDIDCARAFGAVAIAVTTGQYTRAELLADRPDVLFDDLADVETAARTVLAAESGGSRRTDRPRERAGDAGGAGAYGPSTTADPVTVTRGLVPDADCPRCR